MKYEMSVRVTLRPISPEGISYGQQLELAEVNQVELTTLSDAAAVLVKLHELFEEVRKRGAK